MTDQTTDPVQDAGLASPPIQGVEDSYAVKTTHDEYHPPVTNPPEEEKQGPSAVSDQPQPYPGTPTDATGDRSSDLA